MRITEAEDQLFHELNCNPRLTIVDRHCLNPLGELIDCNQKVSLFVLRLSKQPNHIKPPDRKGQVIEIICNS